MKVNKIQIFKKIIPVFLMSILLIIGITGCNAANEPDPSEQPGEQIEDNEDEKPAEVKNTVDDKLKDNMKIVEETSIPEESKEWFDQFNQTEGAYVFQHPDATYIKINSKEQPTGGYSINIKDYLEEEYPRVIIYEIIEPEKDWMVTQAITYPSVILEISSDIVSQYEVRTEDGKALNTEEHLKWAKLELPKINEEISSPVRVKGKIVAFEGSFIVRILDNNNKLIYETFVQADAGGPNWGNFDEEITYPETNSETGSIEIGEYSAKDGEYLLREKIDIKFSK